MSEKCTDCGAVVLTYFMCDEEGDEIHCGDCFEKHPCGKGEHGEDCPTMAIVDDVTHP